MTKIVQTRDNGIQEHEGIFKIFNIFTCHLVGPYNTCLHNQYCHALIDFRVATNLCCNFCTARHSKKYRRFLWKEKSTYNNHVPWSSVGVKVSDNEWKWKLIKQFASRQIIPVNFKSAIYCLNKLWWGKMNMM